MNDDFFDLEPLSEEEALENKGFPKLDDGVYTFTVIESSPGMSHAGNKKIDITLAIIHEGKEFKVWDTLAATKNMAWKVKHLCEATGLADFYKDRRISHNIFLGKSGKVVIGFQPERPKKDGSGVYKARNIVEDYCGDSFNEKNKNENFDDPIPF